MNPKISFPADEVRPDSISCLCRNKETLARPLPSSSFDFVRTPSKEDLPASYGSMVANQFIFNERGDS